MRLCVRVTFLQAPISNHVEVCFQTRSCSGYIQNTSCAPSKNLQSKINYYTLLDHSDDGQIHGKTNSFRGPMYNDISLGFGVMIAEELLIWKFRLRGGVIWGLLLGGSYLWCWWNWVRWAQWWEGTWYRQGSVLFAKDIRGLMSSGQNSQQESHGEWLAVKLGQRWCFPRLHSQLVTDTPCPPIAFLFLCIHGDYPYEILLQIFCRKSDQWSDTLNHSAKLWIQFSKYRDQWITYYVFSIMPQCARKARSLQDHPHPRRTWTSVRR